MYRVPGDKEELFISKIEEAAALGGTLTWPLNGSSEDRKVERDGLTWTVNWYGGEILRATGDTVVARFPGSPELLDKCKRREEERRKERKS